MSSTVACIGFTDPSALAAIVRDHGEPFHELSSTTKWVDDSGAMLLLDRAAQYARPSFKTEVRTPYTGVAPTDGGLAKVVLTDVSGFELDPFTVIPDARYTVGWSRAGQVALVAMGIDTEFFPTAEDFFDSPRSALPGFESEPPPEEVKQFGLPWPPAMEIETFLPSDKADEALALLSGTVQFAEVRHNTQSGHEFLLARVATACGEIDLCSPVPLEGAPAPGAVVVGQVQLLATFPAHGIPDDSTYTAPAERVSPSFRDGDPGEPDIVEPEDEEPLPEGLVLGEDGVVRSTEEHQAWKSGDAEAGSRPRGETVTPAAGSDAELDARPDVATQVNSAEAVGAEVEGVSGEPAAAPAESDTAAPISDAQASADKSAAPAASAQPTASAQENVVDDSQPRPGETRREWRARTGRL